MRRVSAPFDGQTEPPHTSDGGAGAAQAGDGRRELSHEVAENSQKEKEHMLRQKPVGKKANGAKYKCPKKKRYPVLKEVHNKLKNRASAMFGEDRGSGTRGRWSMRW